MTRLKRIIEQCSKLTRGVKTRVKTRAHDVDEVRLRIDFLNRGFHRNALVGVVPAALITDALLPLIKEIAKDARDKLKALELPA